MNRIYYDIEAVNLNEGIFSRKDIHCIGGLDVKTKEQFIFFDDIQDRVNPTELIWDGNNNGNLSHGLQWILDSETISHNGLGYDFIALERALGLRNLNYFNRTNRGLVPFSHIDTYVMSTTLNPERKPPYEAYQLGIQVGGHSIESHGIRIGKYKVQIEDWTSLTDDKITRCLSDCEIGEDFFFYLLKEWKAMLKSPNRTNGLNIVDAYEKEARVSMAMARQALRGFPIDPEAAFKMWTELGIKADKTEAQFRPHMKKRLKRKKYKPSQMIVYVEKMAKAIAEKIPKEYRKGIKVPKDDRLSYLTTNWNPLKKNGEYSANTTKAVPEAVGFMSDYDLPPVVGPFTPITFEDIPMGNHAEVKTLMYNQGWRAVNYSQADQKKIDKGEELKFYAGKIDEDSLQAWGRNGVIPEWCEGITKWYIISSRMSVILNRKDMEYFNEHKQWPSKGARGLLSKCFQESGQIVGEEVLQYSTRRVVAESRYEASRITGAEYALEHDGRFPTSGIWKVPAIAIPNATNTHRMRHKIVVNIPRKGLFPLRHLFISEPDMELLITDGSNLEIRMLLHYLNDPDYTQIALNEDVHNYHMRMTEGLITTRDVVKTFFYALLYGSGIPNLANVCGLTKAVMTQVKKAFMRNMPTLKQLIDALEQAAKKNKYIVSVDGRRSRIRAGAGGKLLLHTVLNTTLQSAGSISMKHGFCIAEEKLVDNGIALDKTGYPRWIEFTHDEFGLQVPTKECLQYDYEIEDCRWETEEKRQHKNKKGLIWSAPQIIEKRPDHKSIVVRRKFHMAGHIIADSMRIAGERLKMRCPLEGEYKIGKNWWECH